MKIDNQVRDLHTLTFNLTPIAKERPRSGKWGFYTPSKTKRFESDIKSIAAEQWLNYPLDGPLMVDVVFRFKRPKSVKRTFVSVKPDCDNLMKALFDSLNKVVWKDDSQIVYVFACKVYDDTDGIDLTVYELEE